MDEYIKKSDAIMAIQPNFIRGGSIEETVLRVAQSKINELPPVEVAPVVHGHWKDIGMGHKKCSECGESYCDIHYAPMNYCPYCGALMDGQTSPRPAHGPETESEVQP